MSRLPPFALLAKAADPRKRELRKREEYSQGLSKSREQNRVASQLYLSALGCVYRPLAGLNPSLHL